MYDLTQSNHSMNQGSAHQPMGFKMLKKYANECSSCVRALKV